MLYEHPTGAREPEAAEQSQVKTFQVARRHLVEQRSSLIKAISFSSQPEQTEAHVDLVVRIQKAIEVIDKAIEEEQRRPQRA